MESVMHRRHTDHDTDGLEARKFDAAKLKPDSLTLFMDIHFATVFMASSTSLSRSLDPKIQLGNSLHPLRSVQAL